MTRRQKRGFYAFMQQVRADGEENPQMFYQGLNEWVEKINLCDLSVDYGLSFDELIEFDTIEKLEEIYRTSSKAIRNGFNGNMADLFTA